MNLQAMIKAACEEQMDMEFRSAYSGRGMYGSTCVGVVGSMYQCQQVIAAVINDVREQTRTVQLGSSESENRALFEQTVDALLNFSTDSMGRDQILYWESIGTDASVTDSQGAESW